MRRSWLSEYKQNRLIELFVAGCTDRIASALVGIKPLQALIDDMIVLARQYGCYGYRRITASLNQADIGRSAINALRDYAHIRWAKYPASKLKEDSYG